MTPRWFAAMADRYADRERAADYRSAVLACLISGAFGAAKKPGDFFPALAAATPRMTAEETAAHLKSIWS